MSGADLARAAEVFASALREAPARRAAHVEAACGGDAALVREVLELLRHHDEAEDGFLDTPATLPDFDLDGTGDVRLGGYRLIERLGAGGMGVVFLAEQASPRRRVALKVLRPGLATPEMVERFAWEAQVLGRLSHPGIAQIHEAATAETAAGPQPYFAMEFVEGTPLTEHARARGLSAHERVCLLIHVCDAVHHAHQKGVVHRDLKPANILVDAAGRPRVLDFGVARAVDGDVQRTRPGEIVGTLAYMSPEQAAGDPDEVDTRADVYALGALGYELLSGRPPLVLEQTALLDCLRVIHDQVPASLGVVRPELRGDLSTIFGKALEKERERRYASAAALADDLRRYLDDEPIAARPASRVYTLRMFTRRNRVLVAAVAGVLVLLAGATAVTGHLALRLADQRDDAREARAAAEEQTDLATAVSAFLGDVLSAAEPGVAGRDASIAEAIGAALERVDERFAGQPAHAAAVHLKLGRILYERGDPRAAGEQGRVAYETLRDLPAADPWSLANSAALFGEALVATGALDDALEVLGHGGAVLEEHGLEGDELFATVQNNLGAALMSQERFEAAEPFLRRAWETRRGLLGPGHAHTLTALNNLAVLLLKTGRPADAEPLLAEILDAWERLDTPGHPNAVTAVYNYADVLRELGRFEESEEYFLEALARGRAALPGEHWLLALHRSRYGELLLELGRIGEARPLLVESHAHLARVLGPEHARTQRVAAALERLEGTRDDAGGRD